MPGRSSRQTCGATSEAAPDLGHDADRPGRPDEGIADLEAWKLIADASPGDDFGDLVTMSSTDDGALLVDLVLFPSRADAVVASEAAIGSQLDNLRTRAGRLVVFYPEPGPFLAVAA